MKGFLNKMIFSKYYSPMGEIVIALDGDMLCGLWFAGQKHFLSRYKTDIYFYLDNEETLKVKNWLDNYFSDNKPNIEQLKIKLEGTQYEMRVWNVLKTIPYGDTITYKDIADLLNIKSYQAIGGAVSRNPISIIIPCHRVIGTNNKITGYAGGIERKLKLLELEGVNIVKFK